MTGPVTGGSGSADFFLNFSTNAGTAAEEMVAGFEPGIAALKSLIELMEQYDTAQSRMGHTGGAGAAGGAQTAEIEQAANRLASLQSKITADLQRTLSGLETVMTKFGAMEQGVVTGVTKATAAVTTLMGDVQGMLDRVSAASSKIEGAATQAGAGKSTADTVRAGVQQVQIMPGSQPLNVKVVNEPSGHAEHRGGTPHRTATSATDDAAKGRTAAPNEKVVVPRASVGGAAAQTEVQIGEAREALSSLNSVLQDLNRSARAATNSVEAAAVRRTGTGRRTAEPSPSRGSQNAPANRTAPSPYVSPSDIGMGFDRVDPGLQRYLLSLRGKVNNPGAQSGYRQQLLNTGIERFQNDPAYASLSDPAQLFARATGVFTPTGGSSFSAEARRQTRTYLAQNLRPTLQQPVSQEAIQSVMAEEARAIQPTSPIDPEAAGTGIGSLLFGKQGAKANLQRHAGNAISNSLSYGLVFTGLEKLREVVKDGLDAQNSFIRLQAVLDANKTSAGGLDQALLNISSQTAQPIEQVVDAASHLAGVLDSASKIEVGVRISAQLANISQGALTATEASQGLVDLISAFPQANLQKVGDQVAQLHNQTGVNVKDIIEGTTQIAQEGREFGLTQPQSSTLAAYISQRTNQSGEQSASQLSRVLGNFNNGTFQKTLIQTGVATQAQFGSGDVAGVLTSLIEKYHQLAPAQQQVIAGLAGTGIQARAFAAMMSIGAEGVKQMNGQLSDQGALASLNGRYLMTVSGSVKELSEDFQNLGLALQRLGAFDAIEILAKSLDIALKGIDNLLMMVSRFSGSNGFTQFLTHAAVMAGEAALAFKVFGGSAASFLGARGLRAPTEASVIARTAARNEGVAAAELPALAYGKVNARQFLRVTRVSPAARLGVSAEEYEQLVAAGEVGAPKPKFLSGAGQRRLWLGTPAAGAASSTEETAKKAKELTATEAFTAALGTGTTTLAEFSASVEAATVAARGGVAGGAVAEGDSALVASEKAAARKTAATTDAALIAGAAGGAGGSAEKTIARSILTRDLATALPGGILGKAGGLAAATVPLAGYAAAGTMLWSAYRARDVNSTIQRNLSTDTNNLFNQQADTDPTQVTQQKTVGPLSHGAYLSQVFGGQGTSTASIVGNFAETAAKIFYNTSLPGLVQNVITGHSPFNTAPATGPSDASGNASLAFNIKEINDAGAVRNKKGVTFDQLTDEDNKISQDYKDNAERISKMGGNDKSAQDEIIRELETAHQRILDSNERTMQAMELRAGITAALSPSQITGLTSFLSGTANLSSSELQQNASAVVSALNSSNGPPVGSPQYRQALAGMGITEVMQTTPSISSVTRSLAAGGSQYVTPGQSALNALALQQQLKVSGNSNAAAGLDAALKSGNYSGLSDWAQANGYSVASPPPGGPTGGDLSQVKIVGSGGTQSGTGQYTYTPASTYQGRLTDQIKMQQGLIDANQGVIEGARFVQKWTDDQGTVHDAQMLTLAQAQAAGGDAVAGYNSSKTPIYAPGSPEYVAANTAVMQGMQTQSQLQNTLQQATFQAPQGAGSYFASIGGTASGGNAAATSNLAAANSAINAYMQKNNIKSDDPQYWQYLSQIQQNKSQIAQLENSPQMNAALYAQSNTNDAMKKAAAASQIAYLKLQQDRAGGADSATIGQDQAATAAAAIAQTQASQQVAAARNQSQIARTRNSVSSLQQQYNESLREENLAANSSTADAATYYRLQQQATQQLQQLHDAVEAQKESTEQATAAMQKAAGHEMEAAQTDLNRARDAYNYAVQQYGSDSSQAMQALAGLAQAQAAAMDAQLTQINSQLDNTIAQLTARGGSGDLQQAAQLQVQKIQNAMAEFLQKGGNTSDSGYQELAGQLAAAQRNAFDVQLQQQLAQLDFQRQTYQITSAQEVQSLQQILKNKQLTLAEQQQIVLQIKSLQDSIRSQLTQGGLNIPSGIILPTAYDVRRSLGAGFSGSATTGAVNAAGSNNGNTINSNNTTTIQVVAANENVAQSVAQNVVNMINNQTKVAASATTSTPRLVPIG